MRSITLTIFHGKGYINSPNFSPNTSLIKVLISFILSEKEKSIGRTILSLHSLLSTFTKNIALEKVWTLTGVNSTDDDRGGLNPDKGGG